MKYTDDIDFLYILEKHGWSSCYLYLDNNIYLMGPTHIFGNPIEALLDSLMLLIDGSNEVSFLWHDEPGEYKWTISREMEQQHLVNITITDCYNVGSEKVESISFQIKLKQFCVSVIKQMEKIQDLLQDKSFSENRAAEFPFDKFKEFTQSYLQIKV